MRFYIREIINVNFILVQILNLLIKVLEFKIKF